VQWVPVENSIKVTIYKASGTKLKKVVCVGEKSLTSCNIGEIVQMVRVGFGRIDEIKKNSVTIIYTHE